MSMEKVHLRKLLTVFYATPSQRRRILKQDIYSEVKKQSTDTSSGGDFHVQFWNDAKAHAAGSSDLLTQTEIRIQSNKSRRRLYPLLATGFLGWWNEKRRWRNEPFEFIEQSPKARLEIQELGATVKVENILAFRVGDRVNRLIYPYFSEEPVLGNEAARLGSVPNSGILRSGDA